jgi:hypothetical protein
VAHETRVLAGNELHAGKRRDRYVFSAPAEGAYDVQTTLSVRGDEGLIPSLHTSSRAARFRVGSSHG